MGSNGKFTAQVSGKLHGALVRSITSFTGHEVYALGFYRLYNYKGHIRVPHLRAHIKGPCNYPETQYLILLPVKGSGLPVYPFCKSKYTPKWSLFFMLTPL